MKAVKAWIVVAAVATTIGAGACGGGAKSTVHSTTPSTTTQQGAGPQSPTSLPSAQTSTTAKTGQVATSSTTTPRLSPQDAAALVLGITGQIQKAEATPNGPQALTRAQAQAIVDAQNKALGIPGK